MKVSAGDPHSNTCTLEIELTWDQAKVLADSAAVLLAVLNTAVQARCTVADRRQEASNATEKQAAVNKAAWAKIYASCEAEIARHSNGPLSNNPGLIKQLAAEHGITTELLTVLLRVYRRDAKAAARKTRHAEILRLCRQGHSQIEIAQRIGVTPRRIRQILDKIAAAGAEQ